MTQNVAARLDVKLRMSKLPFQHLFFIAKFTVSVDDIPDQLYRQMTATQTAANEFLRQFWLAIYPPLSDLQVASVATPAQKAAKAAKMIGYLEQTNEKVKALVFLASQSSVDPIKIQTVRIR